MDDNPSSLSWHCLEYNADAPCVSECLFQEMLELFSKKQSLLTIRQLLMHGRLRFNELMEKVGGSPKTLTVRLREFEEFGLVLRESFNEVPIRVEYSLTPAGKDMEDLFERIATWLRKWRGQTTHASGSPRRCSCDRDGTIFASSTE